MTKAPASNVRNLSNRQGNKTLAFKVTTKGKEEIEAPMWYDLSLCDSSNDEIDDSWFDISHQSHQCSSSQLHSGKVGSSNSISIQEPSSPKLPSSVSKSRGKSYKTRDWGQRKCMAASNKQHPVKALVSKSSGSTGSSNTTKPVSRIVKVKENDDSKACSSGESGLTDTSRPKFAKSSSRSLVRQEQEHKNSSASTVTFDRSEHQENKGLEVSFQTSNQTSELLSSLRLWLRRCPAHATRPAVRVVANGGRRSVGCKSSSNKSSVDSPLDQGSVSKKITIGDTQNKLITHDRINDARVSQPLRNKLKAPNVTKAPVSNVRNLSNRQGNKTLAFKVTTKGKEEIEAPMWYDLSLCDSSNDEIDDSWFDISHQSHQCSSSQLHSGKVGSSNSISIQEPSSPKLPSSVSKSRGKSYKTRDWGQRKCMAASNKQHPVKALVSKSSGSTGSSNTTKPVSRIVKVKENDDSKACSSGESGLTDTSRPKFAKSSSRSLVRQEQEHKNSSASTVTFDRSEHQENKGLEVSFQTSNQTSELLSSLRLWLRRCPAHATRPAVRVVANGGRRSVGCKSSSNKSSVDSPLDQGSVSKKITIGDTQNKLITHDRINDARVSQPLRNKLKAPNVTKAPASNVRNLSNRQGNKTLAFKVTTKGKEEIEAPMWYDLSLCDSSNDEIDDSWFDISHQSHQCSSSQLHSGKVGSSNSISIQEPSSPKLPSSVSKSRGKSYKTRDWGQRKCMAASNKQHPVKALVSKSSGSTGSSNTTKPVSRIVKVKENDDSKACSSGESGLTDTSRPKFAKSSSRSLVRQEQEHKNSSASTVTFDRSEHQENKGLEVSFQTSNQTSELLSSLRLWLRRCPAHATRPAVRVVANGGRRSVGCKSSLNKSSVDSPLDQGSVSKKITIGDTQNKLITHDRINDARVSQPLRNKLKAPNVTKAPVSNVRNLSNRQGNKTLAFKVTTKGKEEIEAPMWYDLSLCDSSNDEIDDSWFDISHQSHQCSSSQLHSGKVGSSNSISIQEPSSPKLPSSVSKSRGKSYKTRDWGQRKCMAASNKQHPVKALVSKSSGSTGSSNTTKPVSRIVKVKENDDSKACSSGESGLTDTSRPKFAKSSSRSLVRQEQEHKNSSASTVTFDRSEHQENKGLEVSFQTSNQTSELLSSLKLWLRRCPAHATRPAVRVVANGGRRSVGCKSSSNKSSVDSPLDQGSVSKKITIGDTQNKLITHDRINDARVSQPLRNKLKAPNVTKAPASNVRNLSNRQGNKTLAFKVTTKGKEEIEAPMWYDLSLCDSSNDEIDDSWFDISHQSHQCSSSQLHSGKVGSSNSISIQEPSSPKLPSSVSKSRGKSYKTRDWGQRKCMAASNKQHPVKALVSKSSGSTGSSNTTKPVSRIVKVKENDDSKACSSGESGLTDTSRPKFAKSSSRSLVRQEQEHKNSSASTVTFDRSEHQENKGLEVSFQTSNQTSELLSSLRLWLRRCPAHATRPAVRVVANGGRRSVGCKSSSNKSSVDSPLDQDSVSKKITIGDTQNKLITHDRINDARVSQPLRNKLKAPNVTKAPASNVRNLSNRQGNKTLAFKVTTKGKEEIEAPMWYDLSLCDSSNDEIDDSWFDISHQSHQCSSCQLHSGKVGSSNSISIQEPSSPKLPSSVSKSRGKNYKTRDWGQRKCMAASNKQHPVKALVSKSSGSTGSSNTTKPVSRIVKVKENDDSKACSSGESGLTDTSRPKFAKSSSRSLVRQEQEHKNSSASTVTFDRSEHQENKGLEVSFQTSNQTSELLSSLRLWLRRCPAHATRPAVRVVANGGRRSVGCKSSSNKSSVDSPFDQGSVSKKITIGDTQNKLITHDRINDARVSQPLRNKLKAPNVTKAPASNVRNLSNRQGNKTLAFKVTTKGKEEIEAPMWYDLSLCDSSNDEIDDSWFDISHQSHQCSSSQLHSGKVGSSNSISIQEPSSPKLPSSVSKSRDKSYKTRDWGQRKCMAAFNKQHPVKALVSKSSGSTGSSNTTKPVSRIVKVKENDDSKACSSGESGLTDTSRPKFAKSSSRSLVRQEQEYKNSSASTVTFDRSEHQENKGLEVSFQTSNQTSELLSSLRLWLRRCPAHATRPAVRVVANGGRRSVGCKSSSNKSSVDSPLDQGSVSKKITIGDTQNKLITHDRINDARVSQPLRNKLKAPNVTKAPASNVRNLSNRQGNKTLAFKVTTKGKEEIEAPMWYDLSLCDSSNDEIDDSWFDISHQSHQCSSSQLHSGKVGSSNSISIQEPSSPKLPSSVSKSRGKSYKTRDWGQRKCMAASNKQHPVKALVSKSSGSTGSSNTTKPVSRIVKVKENDDSKACSSGESGLTDTSRPKFAKSSSRSLVRQEQEHKNSSASTVTFDRSEHQENKGLEVSFQTSNQTSELLSSLRLWLRRCAAHATKPAVRVVANGGRRSVGCKSSSNKSSVDSPLDQGSDSKKITIGDTQNKLITHDRINDARVSQPLRNKLKAPNVTKAPASNVRNLSNRQGNKTLAFKVTTKGKVQQHTSVGKVLMPHKVNEQRQMADKEAEKVGVSKRTTFLAGIKDTTSATMAKSQKPKSSDKRMAVKSRV